jgi:hypothetical protein
VHVLVPQARNDMRSLEVEALARQTGGDLGDDSGIHADVDESPVDPPVTQ